METIAEQSENIVGDTKKYIIITARRLFSKYSYLGVSMSDIAQKLNITKAALYYHFIGKAEIYEKVLDNVFNDLSLSVSQAMSEGTTDKKLHKLIKNYLDFGSKEKNLIKSLMLKLSPGEAKITKQVARLREQVADLIRPVIEEMMVSKKLTEKVDSRLLTSMLTGMMDGLLLEYSFFNEKIDSEKISNQIIALLFQNWN
ncbi:MAG: TetR/AcrR family transcriptional regulator [Candidatus Paceibacterota bacterium]|jgi:AcrR family transcriptional regulator